MIQTGLMGGEPSRRAIVWKDDRNAANHAEFLDFARRSTERQIERMLRMMPVFPDAPEIIVPTGNLWASERSFVFANEFAFAEELRRFGDGLDGFRNASATEDTKNTGVPIERCPKSADNICGPDVTVQMRDVVHHTQAVYARWTADEQSEHCAELTRIRPHLSNLAVIPAEYAWDIQELHHDTSWLKLYRPPCATSPFCAETIQIDGECHLMSSANYVIWGVMARLCGMGVNKMIALISLHKGAILPWQKWRNQKPAENLLASSQWARAGWDGWPDAPKPGALVPSASKVATPPGDRTAYCKVCCPIPYGPRPQPGVKLKMKNGQPFTIHWAPGYVG